MRHITRVALVALLVCWSVSARAQAISQAPIAVPTAVPTAAPTAEAQANRQLVIPFESVNRDPRVFWLGEGSAIILTDDLQALGVPAIGRDDRRRAFDRLRVPVIASLSHATVIRLGQIVGAVQVVVGTFELKGEELTVRARAIRLDTGRITPEIEARGALSDVFGVYAGIAQRLVPNASVSTQEMEQGHPPIAAFEPYVKGLLAEAPATKVTFLEQALKLSPGFQRARLALWEALTDASDYQKALAVARQVPLDSRLSRQARFDAAMSLLSLGQAPEAFSAFSQLNVERADAALLNNLGIVQLRRPVNAPGGRAISFFSQAVAADATDADLAFNLGYAYWLDKDLPNAVSWLRESVRRDPADDAAHYVLGVALQASGSAAEAAREKELARQLSSTYGDWEATQSGANTVPRGLERVKTDLDLAASFRVEGPIVASEQREQRELVAFYLDRGRRLFEQEHDEEAIAELRRVVYLSPYQSDAHLLLGRIYLRSGRTAEAITALKIAVWSDPNNAEAKRLLAETAK